MGEPPIYRCARVVGDDAAAVVGVAAAAAAEDTLLGRRFGVREGMRARIIVMALVSHKSERQLSAVRAGK